MATDEKPEVASEDDERYDDGISHPTHHRAAPADLVTDLVDALFRGSSSSNDDNDADQAYWIRVIDTR